MHALPGRINQASWIIHDHRALGGRLNKMDAANPTQLQRTESEVGVDKPCDMTWSC